MTEGEPLAALDRSANAPGISKGTADLLSACRECMAADPGPVRDRVPSTRFPARSALSFHRVTGSPGVGVAGQFNKDAPLDWFNIGTHLSYEIIRNVS